MQEEASTHVLRTLDIKKADPPAGDPLTHLEIPLWSNNPTILYHKKSSSTKKAELLYRYNNYDNFRLSIAKSKKLSNDIEENFNNL